MLSIAEVMLSIAYFDVIFLVRYIINEAPSQHPEDNLYEYCALAQEICGFRDDFVGSYGSEGVFFGRRQIFRLRPF